MAFDEHLANRVRTALQSDSVTFEEKRIMGGLCFMLGGKMCVGVDGARLMVRLDPDVYEESLGQPGCVPMDLTGNPMRGFVLVEAEGIATRQSLQSWIKLAWEFNPRAKASRRKPSGPRNRSRKPKSFSRRTPRKENR